MKKLFHNTFINQDDLVALFSYSISNIQGSSNYLHFSLPECTACFNNS